MPDDFNTDNNPGTGSDNGQGNNPQAGDAGYRHQDDPFDVNKALDDLGDGGENDPPAMPQGLPPEAWNAATGTIDTNKLLARFLETDKRMNGLRQKLSKGEGLAPKDVTEYEINWPDGYDANDGDAKALDSLKAIGVKHGLTNDQLQGIVGDFIKDAYAENGFWADHADMLTPEEQAAAQAEYTRQEIAKLGPNGMGVIKRLAGAKQAMVAKGILTAAEGQAFEGMIMTADAANVLNKLMPMLGLGDVIPAAVNVGAGGLKSDAEIADMIEEHSKTGDPKLDAEIERQLNMRSEAGYDGPLKARV